ncbi:hypothetical protein SI65_05420 [Aspergillus cristatus]|uniref:Nephrocystin 3-like N-terminal domain-containing protein n=1 Tax=Aspergillus cristatus TaxID=573508 RepID=A0A1E3BCV6_ASPCR|nr:hypothetical protein SI65_05420 [Aspergillus cristatus]
MGQPTIPNAVKDLYDRHKLKQTRPSLSEIRNTLHQIAAFYSRIFIVIDALDECRAAHDGRDMFMQEIFDFQADIKANLFATSRFIQEIEAKFQKVVRLEIRADDTDVQRYLHAKLQNCPSWISQNDSLREQIKNKIAKAVDGMFLLARLYVDSLACKTTPKAIKGALQELENTFEATNEDRRSKALDDAYEKAMQRIQGQVQEHQELKNANVESVDKGGWNPLSLAAENGHKGVVKLLLEKNANTQSMDEYGRTPLSLAAENGHEAVVKLLLEKNANVESVDKGGWTPLIFAARNGHEAIVKLLLEKNANVESADEGGWTPLSLAAQNGHEAVVKLLLEKNANTESKNEYCNTLVLQSVGNRDSTDQMF